MSLKINSYSLLALLMVSTSSMAGTFYDDWDAERVPNQVKETKIYFGHVTCRANIQLTATHKEVRDFYQYVPREQGTSEARPTFNIYAPGYDPKTGITGLDVVHQCTSVHDLTDSYINTETLTWKNKYTPIQPFATHAMYEFGNCRFGTRRGSIDIGIPAGSANNMKVYVSTAPAYPDVLIYNGIPKGFIGYDESTVINRTKKFRIKFDEGSSYYLTSQIPACTSGGGDLEPR
jgi:hypothetical protein